MSGFVVSIGPADGLTMTIVTNLRSSIFLDFVGYFILFYYTPTQRSWRGGVGVGVGVGVGGGVGGWVGGGGGGYTGSILFYFILF